MQMAAASFEPGQLMFQVGGSGAPLILLHGLAGSSDWWQRNFDACCGYFETYRLDFAGFGESRGQGPFDLQNAVRSLMHWMDERGIERAHVVGHSMGGLIAARLAAIAPDRVEKLVLVDAAFLHFDPGLLKRGIGIAREALRSSPEIVTMFIRDSLRAHPLSAITATSQLLRADWRDDLRRITAPLLIIWGALDQVTPLKIGEAIKSAIPGSRLVVIDQAGHNVMWDQPDRFNDVLLSFLST